jgi:membrane protein
VSSVHCLVHLFKRTGLKWIAHDAPRIGAALAYYTLLSLAPLLIFTIAAAGYFFNGTETERRLVQEFQEMAGPDIAQIIQSLLDQPHNPSSGAMASILGSVTLLVGASGVFVELRSALNTMWDVPPAAGYSVLALLRDRLLSIGLVLCFGFLLIASLLVSAILALLGKGMHLYLPLALPVLESLNFVMSFAVITAMFALTLR